MSKLVRPDLSWVSVYWVFAVIVLAMIVVLRAARFPVVVRKEDERAGAWATHKALFKNRTVILFFLGIFAYVGTEQGVVVLDLQVPQDLSRLRSRRRSGPTAWPCSGC